MLTSQLIVYKKINVHNRKLRFYLVGNAALCVPRTANSNFIRSNLLSAKKQNIYNGKKLLPNNGTQRAAFPTIHNFEFASDL